MKISTNYLESLQHKGVIIIKNGENVEPYFDETTI